MCFVRNGSMSDLFFLEWLIKEFTSLPLIVYNNSNNVLYCPRFCTILFIVTCISSMDTLIYVRRLKVSALSVTKQLVGHFVVEIAQRRSTWYLRGDGSGVDEIRELGWGHSIACVPLPLLNWLRACSHSFWLSSKHVNTCLHNT